MEVQIAAAKVNKYATSESGETLGVVERPNGGLSVVLADGQTSRRGDKSDSQVGCDQGVGVGILSLGMIVVAVNLTKK